MTDSTTSKTTGYKALARADRKLNAVKHGACSATYGLLPFERRADYEALLEKWMQHCKPHSLPERECVAAVVRNRWGRGRNDSMIAVFIESDPIGRALTGDGKNFAEAARAEVDKQRKALNDVAELARSLQKVSKVNAEAKVTKSLMKSLDKVFKSIEGIERHMEAYMSFMLGFHERVRRQGKMNEEFDAAFQKRLKEFYLAEQFEETRRKSISTKRIKEDKAELELDAFDENYVHEQTPKSTPAEWDQEEDEDFFDDPAPSSAQA